MTGIGISGRIARAFIQSKLTPIIVVASLMLGLMAIAVTPREEEPQIVVPMVDVFVAMPGASAEEVEQLVTRPVERLLWEIKGLEYVYSIASPGMNLTIVRFYVGEDMEESMVKLYTKLMANYDRIPGGITQPILKARSIDDVPVLSLTLWSDVYSGYELRRVAGELETALKQDSDASEITVTGGQRRQMRVTLDPSRLNAYGVPAIGIMESLRQANVVIPSGEFQSRGKEYIVETGGFLSDAEDVGGVVLGVQGGTPVYLRDVARISDGPEEPPDYVFMGLGPASLQHEGVSTVGQYEAVTLGDRKGKIRRAPEAYAHCHGLGHNSHGPVPWVEGVYCGGSCGARDACAYPSRQLPLRIYPEQGDALCAHFLHRYSG
jgi:multidrug efflux pump subunit AcrB